jgi:hypothetical protein
MQARLLHSGGGQALAQLLSAKPTRAALAWSLASPLTPYPDAERELIQCSSTVSFDAEPASGSLGDACGAFRSIYGLRPMKTAFAAACNPAQKLAIRRLVFHDALHVLLDFKPDWPGQLGVFSFVAAQRYCPQFEWAARKLSQLYMTAAPWLREDLAQAEYCGRQLAHAAPRLLSMPLEQEWGTSLIALQVRSNLKSARSLAAIDWTPRAIVSKPARPLEAS